MTSEYRSPDTVRQATAREYAGLRRRLWLVSTVLDITYLSLWISLAGGNAVVEAFHRWAPAGLKIPWALDLLLVAMALAGPWSVLTFPILLTAGYILPHRFGLSTQSLQGWFGDLGKQAALSLMLGVPSLAGLYFLMRLNPSSWWIWAGVVYSVVTVVLTALAPIFFLPLFYRFVPLEDEHQDLTRRLTRLAEAAGVRICGVYRFDMSRRTRAANAMLTGLGPSRRIVLGDTLLNEFPADEIETVLAHELAHHVHKDIPLGIIIGSVLDLLALYAASLALRWAVEDKMLSAIHDPGGLPVLAFTLGIVGLVLMPLFNTYSRWREAMADKYALHTTSKPLAFAGAMIRLADQNLAEFSPKRWVVTVFHTHPSLQDRVAAAQAYGAAHPLPDHA